MWDSHFWLSAFHGVRRSCRRFHGVNAIANPLFSANLSALCVSALSFSEVLFL